MSAQDRQAALVAAIGAALRGDTALAALLGSRVYDAPPARAVMPSVTVRLVSARDGSTADTEAQLLTFDLDVWDRYEIGDTLGRPRAVMGHIRRILHLQPIPVPGVALLSLLCRSTALGLARRNAPSWRRSRLGSSRSWRCRRRCLRRRW